MTSVATQPARAQASACTGEGPAALSPSNVVDVAPETPANLRSPIQVRSATIGGLDVTPEFYRTLASADRSCAVPPATRSHPSGKITSE